MESTRKPTLSEKKLLMLLIRKASLQIHEHLLDTLMVSDMDDGGMGSLRLFPDFPNTDARKFGSMASDFQFADSDGVQVLASLYLDEAGKLFELDIWKTNFDKLLYLPEL